MREIARPKPLLQLAAIVVVSLVTGAAAPRDQVDAKAAPGEELPPSPPPEDADGALDLPPPNAPPEPRHDEVRRQAPEPIAHPHDIGGGQLRPVAPAPVHPDCEDDCRDEGKCSYWHRTCFISSDAQCAASQLCLRHGRCTLSDDECVATSPNECARSEECREEGHCFLDVDAQRCEVRRNSAAMMVGGIVCMGTGGGGVLIGAIVYFFAAWGGRNADQTKQTAGIAMGVGGAFILAGIPLTVVGAKKDLPDYIPEVAIGPTSTSLSWSF